MKPFPNKLLINGIQKHGTHALLKAVELLGVPIQYGQYPGAELVHLPHTELPDGIKHLFIIRHPKNAFISLLRHFGMPLSTGMLISRMQNLDSCAPTPCSYVELCQPYIGWLSDKNSKIIRFDKLINDGGETIKQIAKYLDVPNRDDAYENLPGLTVTWTGELSNYQKLASWTDDVELMWQSIGGLELEDRLAC